MNFVFFPVSVVVKSARVAVFVLSILLQDGCLAASQQHRPGNLNVSDLFVFFLIVKVET